ncbi:DUF4007 family protein [Lachnospira multipara]|uniref:DUF4007 domain-containing protein n=1 Tax=Lachnospira multipara TaxID=28051 RepID=A0A1H5S3J7_9FIRM|nr:DUF4007 family protein [Lachnospira multipara]SEF45165.1 Protein of unknown function [Lachnospira multipara]
MTNENTFKLQGHEKFALREGWLTKGLVEVKNSIYDNVFLEKDAAEIFGIGNNMVKSLRYWMKVLGLTNNSGSELTEFGDLVARYDIYIEDPFTLWIMHSNISKDVQNATSWYMYFNKCDAEDLDKNQIHKILYREISKYAPGKRISERSLDSDIDVLLNMYSKRKENDDPEDKNVSPFSQLFLIKNSAGKYSKLHPSMKGFSELIVLYEIALKMKDRETLAIDELINGECGLNKIYNISGVVVNDYLDKLDAAGFIRVDRTAGLDMIYSIQQLDSNTILEKYYENK